MVPLYDWVKNMVTKKRSTKKFRCDGTDEGCNWQASAAQLAEFDRLVEEHMKKYPNRRMALEEMDKRWPTP